MREEEVDWWFRPARHLRPELRFSAESFRAKYRCRDPFDQCLADHTRPAPKRTKCHRECLPGDFLHRPIWAPALIKTGSRLKQKT
jgi:hypothetical protein